MLNSCCWHPGWGLEIRMVIRGAFGYNLECPAIVSAINVWRLRMWEFLFGHKCDFRFWFPDRSKDLLRTLTEPKENFTFSSYCPLMGERRGEEPRVLRLSYHQWSIPSIIRQSLWPVGENYCETTEVCSAMTTTLKIRCYSTLILASSTQRQQITMAKGRSKRYH